MKRVILLILLLCAVFAAEDFSWADDGSWLIVLEYDNGVVSVVEQKALDGPPPSIIQEGDYSLSVTSSGATVLEESFGFPLITLYDAPPTDLFSDDGSQKFTPDGGDVVVVEEKAQVELIISKAMVSDTLLVKDASGLVVVEAPMVEIAAKPPGVTPPPGVILPPGTTPPPGDGQNTSVPDDPGEDDNFLLVLGGGFLLVAGIVLVFAVGLLYVLFRVFGSKPKPASKHRKKV